MFRIGQCVTLGNSGRFRLFSSIYMARLMLCGVDVCHKLIAIKRVKRHLTTSLMREPLPDSVRLSSKQRKQMLHGRVVPHLACLLLVGMLTGLTYTAPYRDIYTRVRCDNRESPNTATQDRCCLTGRRWTHTTSIYTTALEAPGSCQSRRPASRRCHWW